MEFFFPDSADLVDPDFDFERESRNLTAHFQHQRLYAHECFEEPPMDGLLLSMAIVEGTEGSASRFSLSARNRLTRRGVRDYYRLDKQESTKRLKTMGDCGAFSYVKEETPPVTVDQVLDFYEGCQFDYGISVDHIILNFKLNETSFSSEAMKANRERQSITLEYGEEFFKTHKSRSSNFTPIGVAQGWNPASYAYSFKQLQKIGYKYIALGGMVGLKSQEIIEVLDTIKEVKLNQTKIHLLGVTRLDKVSLFEKKGVTSIDSTSPLKQAFKDKKDNYHHVDSPKKDAAILVPQVDGNTRVKNLIKKGVINQGEALKSERECLKALKGYQNYTCSIEHVLDVLDDYDNLLGIEKQNRRDMNRATLEQRAWERCPCAICKQINIDVVIFRGAERNRRRGFHNLYAFYQKLKSINGNQDI